MVWYKKCVAYGGDPTDWTDKNLYKVYKRVAQLRSSIQKMEKCRSKYTKKYGTSAGANLFKGRFVGLSLNVVKEFAIDATAVDVNGIKYVLQAYEPTVNDVIKYGRGVKRYILCSSVGLNLTQFKVLNYYCPLNHNPHCPTS